MAKLVSPPNKKIDESHILTTEKVKEIQQLNSAGRKIVQLTSENVAPIDTEAHTYHGSMGQESIDRFDQNSKNRRKKRKKPILTRKFNSENENKGNQEENRE